MTEKEDIEITIPIYVSKKDYVQMVLPGADAYGLSVEAFILEHVLTGQV